MVGAMTEAVAIHQISPDLEPKSTPKRSPDFFRRPWRHATSPTTGQTRPRSAPSKRSSPKGVDPNSRREARPPQSGDAQARTTTTSPGSPVVPIDLYPLSSFLRTLLNQEKTLWERNEILLKSLKSKSETLLLP